jgi:hypothetical protein
MSFAWSDYLTLAEALLQGRATLAPEEACCRAAISRAYYAVYGAARTRARAIRKGCSCRPPATPISA